MNNVYYGNNSTVTGGCKSGYTQVGGDIKYTCSNGSWSKTGTGECKLRIMVEYFSPSNNGSYSKEFLEGDTITCNKTTFDNRDPGSGVVKLCRINGYVVSYENKSFTVSSNIRADNTSFCHGSYIPRDLINNIDGKVNLSGIDNEVSKTTLKGNVTDNNGVLEYKPTNALVKLKCTNGKWSVTEGYRNFNYINSGNDRSQKFVSPYGVSKLTLEVWGAQGGKPSNDNNTNGGKGGKNTANYTITSSKTLYVVVGGKGKDGVKDNPYKENGGGYNGGGNSTGVNKGCGSGHHIGGYGGGATHISTGSGLLKDSSARNGILIVAGGGGGASKKHDGGSGGGNGDGDDGNGNAGGRGGTTTAGGGVKKGSDHNNGTEGKGGDQFYNGSNNSATCGGSGGGGYFGGGSGNSGSDYGAGGGGSGYCGIGDCDGENGVREGNGYAKISW